MNQVQCMKKIDQLLSKWMKNEQIPGLGVSIVQGEDVLFSKGYGITDVHDGCKITTKSLFHTASISKTFVSLALMQLIERGLVSLNDSVVCHVPYFTLNDVRYKDVTLRQLLGHISGMPDEVDFGWDQPETDGGALERYVRSLANKRLLSEPGTQFRYSNIAFELLGDVIQNVTGLSFEVYMKQFILDPIGMSESHFLKAELNQSLLTSPHILTMDKRYGPKVSDVFPYNRRHAPSSTLCSNLEDMSKYMSAVSTNKLISKQLHEDMMVPQHKTGWGDAMSGIGLGWFSGEYKEKQMMSHSGLDTGFRSHLLLLPDEGYGITLLSNCDYIGLQVVWQTIVDVLFGEEVDRIKPSLARHLAKSFIEHGVQKTEETFQTQAIPHYLVIEGELNFVAYELFENEKVVEAISLLKLSLQLFPDSSNLNDSLGEMSLANGDKAEAIASFNRAIALDPDNVDANENLKNAMNTNESR
ncbi:serine hydrolase [Bacillus sp. JCM 19041]|uniref:serine hydrolase n=1 Tax=Bacillus sp. JCM 19041 TaxID=1460637 RepID=UPI0006CF7E81